MAPVQLTKTPKNSTICLCGKNDDDDDEVIVGIKKPTCSATHVQGDHNHQRLEW
jgi:hypothetical protein